MTRVLRNKFGDTSGTIPQPKDARDALKLIQKIARDKRKHVMLSDYCDLLELKLRIISVLATRGIRASVTKLGKDPRCEHESRVDCDDEYCPVHGRDIR